MRCFPHHASRRLLLLLHTDWGTDEAFTVTQYLVALDTAAHQSQLSTGMLIRSLNFILHFRLSLTMLVTWPCDGEGPAAGDGIGCKSVRRSDRMDIKPKPCR